MEDKLSATVKKYLGVLKQALGIYNKKKKLLLKFTTLEMVMKLKKYLVPLSTLIAAIPLASANNQIDSSFYNKSSGVDEKLPNLSSLNSLAIGKLFEYSRGDELHSLIVKPNESGVMLSYHASHASHASHYSRR